MPERGTSGSLSGDGKRSGVLAATALILDSTQRAAAGPGHWKGGALQAAEKPVWPVIPRSRRRRGISHCLENTQGEIPRSARNDSLEGFFRSL